MVYLCYALDVARQHYRVVLLVVHPRKSVRVGRRLSHTV